MDIDLNLLRNVITLIAFASFLGIVLWAYAPARKARLEQAAQSILEEDAP